VDSSLIKTWIIIWLLLRVAASIYVART